MKAASATLALLLFAAASHFLVDAVGGTLNPLWPRMDTHYQLLGWESATLFFIWQMTNSVSQFWFGMFGDRFHARWLIAAGPIAAILCLGCIGLTDSPLVLGILLAIAGLGIAAFHPEAAALAGSCAPEHRSRAMSIFTMGGFLGQATGPIFSGCLVDALGLRGMIWTILAGLTAVAVLAPLSARVFSQPPPRQRPVVRVRDAIRGRTAPLLLVLIIGSLRIIAAGGVPVLMGYVLQARGTSAADTGFVQSAFMLGIGLGGLTCATLVRHHHERHILWLCPLVVAPVLLSIPWSSGALLTIFVCFTGLMLGISLPVLISYGQQLMPESQRLASSITMGVSWGLGGGLVSVILATCKYVGRYEPAFLIFAIATLLSSALCIWLPAIGSVPASAPPAELETVPG